MSVHSQLLRDLHPDLHATEDGTVFFKWTEAAGKVVQDIADALDDVKNQLFVVSADWRLTYWEALLSIGTDTTLTTEQRRSRIIARLTATGITVQAIKDVAETFIGVEPTVIEWLSRGFRADVSHAGEPCIEEDDMFLFEVLVPPDVDTGSYSHSDLEGSLSYHKPGHTTLIVTHPEQFTLSLDSPNPQDVAQTSTTTFNLTASSTRSGRISFTAKVTAPSGQEDAIVTFDPVSQSSDSSPLTASFDWTAPAVGTDTPYTILVEAWGENGGYASETYTGTITA